MDAYSLNKTNLTDYGYDNYAAVWHFEESYPVGSNYNTYESSHNAPDLNLSDSNAKIDYGKFGNGLSLGGNSQAEAYVNVSETAYTTGLWFKADALCLDCGIFTTDGGTGNEDKNDRNIYLDINGHLCVDLLGPETRCTSPEVYNNDTWYYVVHVFENKTGGEQKLYVNGLLKETGTLKYSNRTAQTRVIIGSSTKASYNFIGEIDDVKIWNRALAPWEIIEEYQKLL